MVELCTESSHVNPLLGPGLLLSLPPVSFCLLCVCLCHFVCSSCYISFSLSAFLFLILCFPPFACFFASLSSRLSIQLVLVTDRACLTVLSLDVTVKCVTDCHFALRASNRHPQVWRTEVSTPLPELTSLSTIFAFTVCLCVFFAVVRACLFAGQWNRPTEKGGRRTCHQRAKVLIAYRSNLAGDSLKMQGAVNSSKWERQSTVQKSLGLPFLPH